MRILQKFKLLKELLIIFIVSIVILTGNLYICNSEVRAAAVKNGWVAANGTWYYYNNGTLMKNAWELDSHGWCFLNSVNGSWVKDGWAKDSHGWCYIGTDGYWVNHAIVVKDSVGYCIIGDDGYWTGKRQETGNVIPISSFNLNKSTDKLRVGETDALTVAVLPENASNKNIVWSSSDNSILSVDRTGKVTAVSVGTAVVTAVSQDGSKSTSCTFTVVAKETVFTVDEVAENAASIVYIEAKNNKGISYAFGSGCIISSDGTVITNYHVIDGAYNLVVKTKDGTEYGIEGVLGYSKDKDLAILKLKNATGLPVSKLGDSDAIEVGQQIVAIGNPLGSIDKVSTGTILGVNDSNSSLRVGKDILISAPIDHGSSGGGLYDMNGQIVGITYALGADDNGNNLYFAIPINDVKPLLGVKTITSIEDFYALNKPEITNIVSLKTEQTFTLQPYYFDSPKNISLQLMNVYSGVDANSIIQYENMFNDSPRSDEQWILMKYKLKYNSGSSPLYAYNVVFDDFYTEDGEALPVITIAAFSKDRYGHNVIDPELHVGDQTEFWFGILVQKTPKYPLVRIGTGYDKTTFETIYNWYSLN